MTARLPRHVASLAPGEPTALGPYQLLGRLDEGITGIVYLSRAVGGAQVAIRALHPGDARRADMRARFAAAVERARGLTGPYTCGVLDAAPDADRPYLVTEFVGGPTLAREIVERGPLSADETGRLARTLLETIAAAHRSVGAHGDLTATDIVLSVTGPRLVDLNVAAALRPLLLSGGDGTVGGPAGPSGAGARGDGPAAAAGDTPGFVPGYGYGPAAGGWAGTAADIVAWAGIVDLAATGKPSRALVSSARSGRRRGDRSEQDLPINPGLRSALGRVRQADGASLPDPAELLALLAGARPASARAGRGGSRSRSRSRQGATAVAAAGPLAPLALATAPIPTTTQVSTEAPIPTTAPVPTEAPLPTTAPVPTRAPVPTKAAVRAATPSVPPRERRADPPLTRPIPAGAEAGRPKVDGPKADGPHPAAAGAGSGGRHSAGRGRSAGEAGLLATTPTLPPLLTLPPPPDLPEDLLGPLEPSRPADRPAARGERLRRLPPEGPKLPPGRGRRARIRPVAAFTVAAVAAAAAAATAAGLGSSSSSADDVTTGARVPLHEAQPTDGTDVPASGRAAARDGRTTPRAPATTPAGPESDDPGATPAPPDAGTAADAPFATPQEQHDDLTEQQFALNTLRRADRATGSGTTDQQPAVPAPATEASAGSATAPRSAPSPAGAPSPVQPAPAAQQRVASSGPAAPAPAAAAPAAPAPAAYVAPAPAAAQSAPPSSAPAQSPSAATPAQPAGGLTPVQVNVYTLSPR